MADTLYFVAGEASGDNHGAALMRALQERHPSMQFVGRGGPQMAAMAGHGLVNWIDQAAVVGLWDVVKNYGYFRKQFHQVLREIEERRPDAVVLIDYPGFNLRLARALHEKSGHPRVLYYISPQVWAWNRGRIKHMARWLDLMLCIFPFEAELYNRSGLRTIFVGHPMHERLSALRSEDERDPSLIGLFPGSRRREVRKILPIMLEAAHELVRVKPGLRFEIAAVSQERASDVQGFLESLPNEKKARFEIRVGAAASLMQRAGAGMVASGSATLEAAYFRLPFVLIYKVAWLTYVAGRLVVKVAYLGMPNVLADRAVVPEFIQHKARPRAIADAVRQLIDDAGTRTEMIHAFDQIIGSLGEGGASDRAADAIVQELRA